MRKLFGRNTVRVIRLTKKSELKKFVSMPDAIYRGDRKFVPYMRRDLYCTLVELVLKEQSYTALAVEQGGRYVARLLFTVEPSKQLHIARCGFFSHFETVDDERVVRLLFDEAARLLKEAGATYLEGTYFPYDRDNRRGILKEGFDTEPMILTSYNPPYYPRLLEEYGFHKDFDTVSYHLDYAKYDLERITRVTDKVKKRYGLYVSCADFSKLDREIDDVHEVILAATNDIIFDDAPTREDLERIVKNWRTFLWQELIFIVRTVDGDRPVGVMMAVPDYNTVFRGMNGKINPVSLCKMLRLKRKINSVRAILQYVVPEYQNKGVNFILYQEFYKTTKRLGIVGMEAGTIMENNEVSRKNVEAASGTLKKVFRIYGMEL